MIYFEVDTNPYYKGTYSINFKHYGYKHLPTMHGSGTVLFARIMGITYPNYIRMCRDVYGAQLDKKGLYFGIRFTDRAAALQLARILDKRFLEIIKTLGLKPKEDHNG